MKILVVYCHPSEDSFTAHVRDSFIQGIISSGGAVELSDLYKMNFTSDLTESEYLREVNYRDTENVPADVASEQNKIQNADSIAFIYPVFWTEAPAKLVGWFDRVWTYGFAYGNRTMKLLDKAYVLCTAGNSTEYLCQLGHIESMKRVMFGDRLFNRSKTAKFNVFGEMSKKYPQQKTTSDIDSRTAQWDAFLCDAYNLGVEICNPLKLSDAFNLDGKLFASIQNSANGEVETTTRFLYRQDGELVWAEYSGEGIRKGFLIGTVQENSSISFSYQHLNRQNQLRTGKCILTPERLSDGRLRLYEKWEWTNGDCSCGESIIEECR